MKNEELVELIEEMVDLKIQQHTEAGLKGAPEVLALLQQKRATDRRRLEQIKGELTRLFQG